MKDGESERMLDPSAIDVVNRRLDLSLAKGNRAVTQTRPDGVLCQLMLILPAHAV